jgi:hypothetical protein
MTDMVELLPLRDWTDQKLVGEVMCWDSSTSTHPNPGVAVLGDAETPGPALVGTAAINGKPKALFGSEALSTRDQDFSWLTHDCPEWLAGWRCTSSNTPASPSASPC